MGEDTVLDTMVLTVMLLPQLPLTTVPMPSQLSPKLKKLDISFPGCHFIGFKKQNTAISYTCPIYSRDGIPNKTENSKAFYLTRIGSAVLQYLARSVCVVTLLSSVVFSTYM